MNSSDVIVIGAGVIGLSIAWRCSQRGMSVTIIDPTPGAGASATAAGMLAPVTELHFEGRDLLALNLDSAARYPAFAAELAELTGLDAGFRRCGTVQAAWDAADLAALRQVHSFQQTLQVTSQMLTSRELRSLEPALAAGLPGGLWAEDDHQIDNRLLHAALMAAVAKAGVRIVAARVTEVITSGGAESGIVDSGSAGPEVAATVDAATAPVASRAHGDAVVSGVVTDGGESYRAAVTVLAAGAWSRGIAGLPDAVLPPVRPVKGQTLRLRGPQGLLTHVVRGNVKGNAVYIVPRSDGNLVIGASSEEAGFDVRPRAGAVYELLRDAATLVPELSEAEFVEVSTSLRPGSPDNAPMIGRAAIDGLIVATGHFRNGILLSPITGDEVARLIAGEPTPILAPFNPSRFARARRSTTGRSSGGSAVTAAELPQDPRKIEQSAEVGA